MCSICGLELVEDKLTMVKLRGVSKEGTVIYKAGDCHKECLLQIFNDLTPISIPSKRDECKSTCQSAWKPKENY